MLFKYSNGKFNQFLSSFWSISNVNDIRISYITTLHEWYELNGPMLDSRNRNINSRRQYYWSKTIGEYGELCKSREQIERNILLFHLVEFYWLSFAAAAAQRI